MVSSSTLNNLLRYQGRAFFGMIGMVSGAALNILLDPIFIFGLRMGVTGASLATMISQTVCCVLLFTAAQYLAEMCASESAIAGRLPPITARYCAAERLRCSARLRRVLPPFC
jgi:Na+-driven multidrug efflux pump